MTPTPSPRRLLLSAGVAILCFAARVWAAPTLPLELRLETVVVPVRINGGPTLHCILDTGMPTGVFLMDPETAAACELKPVGQAQVRGAGAGTVPASIAMGAEVQVGSIRLSDQRVIALNERGPLAHLGVDGAIGTSLFSRYVVQFDFDQGHVAFLDPQHFEADAAGQPIPLTFVNTKPVMEAVWNRASGEAVNVQLMIDTGASAALVLNPPSHEQLVAPPDAIPAHLGAGVGGDVTGVLGRIHQLRVGTQTLNDLVVGFADTPADIGHGTIGMEALRRFLLTIDYPHQRLLLKPNASHRDPFEATLTGLAAKPNTAGEVLVHGVMRDSPAADAGLQVGDKIITIDDRPVDFPGFRQVIESLVQPGQVIQIGLERDHESVATQLTLRRLL